MPSTVANDNEACTKKNLFILPRANFQEFACIGVPFMHSLVKVSEVI